MIPNDVMPRRVFESQRDSDDLSQAIPDFLVLNAADGAIGRLPKATRVWPLAHLRRKRTFQAAETIPSNSRVPPGHHLPAQSAHPG